MRLYHPLALLYAGDSAHPTVERPRSEGGKAGWTMAELGEVSSTTAIARHLGKDKSNVSHELAGLIQAGKVVKGQRDGRVVPYLLVE